MNILERILVVLLGITLVAVSVASKKEVRSAEAERDFWKGLYTIERRHGNVTCVPVDTKFSLCERSK